ncbi:B12-binding domain-containing radical SAM protein [Sporomusa acidovorans]|uniref:Radical SAM core domain-containing protein n=1 Tax=Sporomusa acidovorans (strain ATCC 49682 / DSM 3132 / Mol) TaxID=1123286 RepID=A0ABZ3IZX8_SPOA4|nr:radical SAM protein [Sporomusa acidovorans]OZC14181.1 oxygen-independent coproporphyrinogen-III oxidase-like protein YqeR [Sporomusa acidovorans DSM 3132]SDE70574.1 Radical SAM superfamily protein [Sporomusa acidovorans]
MRYEGDIYSPHMAGDDYILQCTIGCSHNQCTFCYMYKNKKYRVRELKEILKDIDLAKEYYGEVEKVFLADGDALSMPAEDLIKILNHLYDTFPHLSYVGTYASAGSILKKTLPELSELQEHGLVEVHLGVESGDEDILRTIQKGVTRAEMVQAGRKVRQAGINLVVTVILGLAGRSSKAWQHAKNTARICNEIQPDYLGFLTIIVHPGTEIYDKVQRGEFEIPEEMEILQEMRLMIQGLQLEHCGITSIHPSNCLHVESYLPAGKSELLQTLTQIIDNKDFSRLCSRKTESI